MTSMFRIDQMCVRALENAFSLTSHVPVTNAVGVAQSQTITASFDANVNGATMTTHTLAGCW